jgi:dTDP-4-dehydrorhamnose reductase
MKLLITGANSYVGARLYLDLSPKYPTTGTYAHSPLSSAFVKLDITVESAVHEAVATHKPDVIVHVAANANARWCETHPDEAMLLNKQSTEYLVDAANEKNIPVIYISSYAAIAPANVYAHTKKDSEEIVKKTKAGYCILRPSFILGFSPNTTNDRPFNRLLRNLDDHVPAVYDTSWRFYATHVGHISEVIDACLSRGIFGETIHVVSPTLTTRYETARDILTPFGVEVTPIDHHDTLPVNETKPVELARLKLPEHGYREIMDTIVEEIRHRDRFVLA